jgi:N-acetylmuramic acid 6-phosphate (MurNAc-6-P) etherase
MFDTYGEDHFTVRGFVERGWETMKNADGDLSKEGPLFNLSWDDFQVEKLNDKDTVIFPIILLGIENLNFQSALFSIAIAAKKKLAKTALIVIGTFNKVQLIEESQKISEFFNEILVVDLPRSFILKNTSCLAEFAAKLVFNAITTGACVRKGRVYRNTMINLGVR